MASSCATFFCRYTWSVLCILVRLQGENSIKAPICPHYLISIPIPRDLEEKDFFSKLVPICGLLGRLLGLHVDIMLHVMGVYFLIFCCHRKTVVFLLRSLQLAVMYVSKAEPHIFPVLSCLHLSPLLAHVIIFQIPRLLQKMTSTPTMLFSCQPNRMKIPYHIVRA